MSGRWWLRGTTRWAPAAWGRPTAGTPSWVTSSSVHGIDNLRVADASIMPRITRAPTNLTAIAIGERAASFIAAG